MKYLFGTKNRKQKTSLGVDFIHEFEKGIIKIGQNPNHASYIFEDARSISLRRFPYQIIYKIDEESSQVRILPVIHHHRNPDWFRKRLNQ